MHTKEKISNFDESIFQGSKYFTKKKDIRKKEISHKTRYLIADEFFTTKFWDDFQRKLLDNKIRSLLIKAK